jgi:hypothetical protein
MIYHVPQSTSWRPDAVKASLVAKRIPARIDSGVLLIDVPRAYRPNHFALSLRRFSVWRSIIGAGDFPCHEFRYYKERLVFNLEIHWNMGALARDERICAAVREAMCALGYVELGHKQTERSVIQGYGAIGEELNEALGELEQLRQDHESRRQDVQHVWARIWDLHAAIERLCVSTISV